MSLEGWLDVHILPDERAFRVDNTSAGQRMLKRRLNGRDVDLIVIEATGKWHRQVHRSRNAAGHRVAVVNPLRARLFAEAIGALAKPVLGPAAGRTRGTDRLDARLLAPFAASAAPAARPPAPAAVEALKQLVQARDSRHHRSGPRSRTSSPAPKPPSCAGS